MIGSNFSREDVPHVCFKSDRNDLRVTYKHFGLADSICLYNAVCLKVLRHAISAYVNKVWFIARCFFWGGGFYSPSRLFHLFWARPIARDENGRSLRKTTWPPAGRTWLFHMWSELGSNPQRWDDERFNALTTQPRGPPIARLIERISSEQCTNT